MPGLFFESGIDNDFERDLKKMDASLNKFSKNTNKYTREVSNSFEQSSKKTVKSLTKTKSALSSTLQQIFAFAGIGAILAGVGAAFKSAFNTIKEFATGISELKALTTLQGESLEFLKKRALELAATYGKSAKEIVDAMKLVGSARPELLDNAQALGDMTDKVILLSRASGLDLEKSTAALTGSLNQFNAPASKAGEFLDILASAAQKGSKEIPFLSDFILRSGKIAKDANISFKNLTTAAELLGPSFNSPEVAATGFNRVLLNLQKAGIGYTTGSFELSEALTEVQSQLDGMSSESKKAAFQNKIFGEGLTVGKILLETNGAQFEDFANSIGASGSAMDQAAERMNNLQGDIDKAGGAWDRFILSLDEGSGVFSKVSRAVTQTGTGLINMLTTLNTEYTNSATKAVEMNKAAEETIPLWDTQIGTLEFLIPKLKDLRLETERIAALRGKSITKLGRSEGTQILSLLVANKELTTEELKQLEVFVAKLKVAENLNKVQKAQLSLATRILKENAKASFTPKTSGGSKKADKTSLNYYQLLQEALKDAQLSLENLSAKESEINQGQVLEQQKIITNIQNQIITQEELLGLKQKTIEEVKKEREAEEGSLLFLEKKISATKENVKYATSPQLRASFEDEVMLLQTQLKDLKGVGIELKKNESSWSETLQVINGVQTLAEELIGSFTDLNDITQIMVTSVIEVSSGIIGLINGVKAVETAVTSLEKASAILAVIALALKVFFAVTKAFDKAAEARQKSHASELEKIQAINLALIDQNRLYKEGNEFFSTDKWGTALSGLNAYNQALQFQQGVIDEIATGEQGRDISTLFFGAAGQKEQIRLDTIRSAAQKYSTELEQALASVSVKTKNRSTIGNFFGRADEFDSLLRAYPALIQANGELDQIVLQTALDTADLAETDRVRLENLLELTQKAEEAYSQFGDFISSTFGGVADDITQAFQVMFESGEDAMTSLEGSFSDMIEKFTRDAIEFTFLQPYLNELNSSTKALGEQFAKGDISAEALQSDIVSTLGDFYGSLQTLQPQILTAFENADIAAAAAGFESAFNPEEQVTEQAPVKVEDVNTPTTSGGVVRQTITEETGGVLSGRLGAMVLSNQAIVNQGTEMLDYAVRNLQYQKQISENTSYLPQIEENTRKMNDKL